MRLICRLDGSYYYCQIGRGICCAVCGCRDACDKACQNSPARCGCASHDSNVPGLTPQKGGAHAGTETAD